MPSALELAIRYEPLEGWCPLIEQFLWAEALAAKLTDGEVTDA